MTIPGRQTDRNRPSVNTGRQIINTESTDSLQRRDKFADSITIYFRYLDSTRNYLLDSSVNDFTRRFPVPATNIYLGNIGNASRSLLFSPSFNAGWDHGFHSFDVYKWFPEKVRFFSTTRPYTELGYLLGSRVEQIIEVLHTQNIKPTWNASMQYRLINAPGFFKNQKTNHNNYLFNSWFQSENKRYNNYFMFVRNKINSGENGGIKSDHNYIDDVEVYKDRFNIPTNIGGDPVFGRNFFTTTIPTGNNYSESIVMLRQQYDFGKKDSLITDSLVIPLFYPRVRFEHTFRYKTTNFQFKDQAVDTAYYKMNYDTTLLPFDTLIITDNWREFYNDFSIYQFPDAKNLHQFIKVGASIQNIKGELRNGKNNFYNIMGHAEYRNKTRNQKWDMEVNGKLYFAGLNAGDYQAYASLQRYAGKKLGYIQLGFENTNRSPSFIFDSRSSFYFLKTNKSFKNENSSHFFASFFNPAIQMRLSGHYYLLTNYTYIKSFYHLEQENTLFNVFRAALQKTINIGKRWKWHADIYFQKTIGDAPVNLPMFYTRNRIGYEGNLGFKNLDIAFGMEIKYFTPFKADAYSPVLGQFFYQDSVRISNPLPDISPYIHFRIRSFKAFIRGENLNTYRYMEGDLGFTNNNFVAPGYPMPGLVLRLGIYWNFVN